MSGNRFCGTSKWISPQRVCPTLTLEHTSVTPEMLEQRAAFHSLGSANINRNRLALRIRRHTAEPLLAMVR